MKNIRFFLFEIFLVLEVKLSIHLNRRVFVMDASGSLYFMTVAFPEAFHIFFLYLRVYRRTSLHIHCILSNQFYNKNVYACIRKTSLK